MNLKCHINRRRVMLLRMCRNGEAGVSAVIAPASMPLMPKILRTLSVSRAIKRRTTGAILFATEYSDSSVRALRQEIRRFAVAKDAGSIQGMLKVNRAVACVPSRGPFAWADALDALPLDIRFTTIVVVAKDTPAETCRDVALLDRFTDTSTRLILLGADRWGHDGMGVFTSAGWHHVELTRAGDIVICQRHVPIT